MYKHPDTIRFITLKICAAVLLSVSFYSCGGRVYDNPFDKDSHNYVGNENITDINNNDTVDVLEPRLILIPDTCFMMGSETGMGGTQDEAPVHKVCVDSFFIGETEVSVGQFRAVFPGKNYDGKSNLDPMSNITWYEAVEYCNRLSSIHRLNKVYSGIDQYIKIDYSQNGFRLLSEAEWERAAGANSGQKYYWGNTLDNSMEYAWSLENSREKPHEISQLKPNRYGIYDMSGNVWEWINDWYKPGYSEEINNPRGPITGESKAKVIRGGSYLFSGYSLRVTNRGSLQPGESLEDLGFRLARTARPKNVL